MWQVFQRGPKQPPCTFTTGKGKPGLCWKRQDIDDARAIGDNGQGELQIGTGASKRKKYVTGSRARRAEPLSLLTEDLEAQYLPYSLIMTPFLCFGMESYRGNIHSVPLYVRSMLSAFGFTIGYN